MLGATLQDETEYETDSEDEVYGQQLLKPVFVPKADREVDVPGPGSHVMPVEACCWLQFVTIQYALL